MARHPNARLCRRIWKRTVSLRSRGQVQKIRPHALVCPILGHTQPAALGARACRDRRRLAKRFWRGGAAQGRGPSKLGRRRCYARRVAEIVGSHRSLRSHFRSFLVEMPGSAPTYKRECNASNASSRHPAWSGRYSSRWIFSALSITGSLIRRWIGTACPRHSCDATG